MNESNIRELMQKIAVAAKAQNIFYVTVMLTEKGSVIGTNMSPEDAALVMADCAGSVLFGSATQERCKVDVDEAFDQPPASLS